MRITRDTVRIVVPPLLALGLVAALAHPADAGPAPVQQRTPVAQTVGR
ncbi:hypothetical protein [Longivirga aurantiaca]|uniref:Uncharacterized protein n=1 Tax=Longivirga aurantiaca TaxID=1837743 RepID=A0ABW1SW03_9ACTN